MFKMKMIAFMVLFASATLAGPAIRSPSEAEAVSIATKVLADMESAQFDSVTLSFSDEMKAALTAEALAGVQSQLSGAGGVVKQDTPRVSKQAGMWVVVVRIHREQAVFDVTLAIDAKGSVAGLYFAPAKS